MRRPFEGNFVLTQPFGNAHLSRDSQGKVINPYTKFGMLGHNGLDYGLPTGTPILAPHGGRIIEATNDPTGYGLYVKIENNVEGSVLAHLRNFAVKVGDQVAESQVIGYSDNTGNSTGPHLHWGYYKFPRNRQNGYAGFIDQAPLLPSRDSGTTQGNMYKGYDLTNKESMKIAVDVLVKLQSGELVEKVKLDEEKNKVKRIKDFVASI